MYTIVKCTVTSFIIPVHVWRCAWQRWWDPVQRCRPGNRSRNKSCCSSLSCGKMDSSKLYSHNQEEHTRRRNHIVDLCLALITRKKQGFCYLTSKRSSRAMKIPGMTMSPKPSMAKLLASSPFSSKSWGKTTENKNTAWTSVRASQLYMSKHLVSTSAWKSRNTSSVLMLQHVFMRCVWTHVKNIDSPANIVWWEIKKLLCLPLSACLRHQFLSTCHSMSSHIQGKKTTWSESDRWCCGVYLHNHVQIN